MIRALTARILRDAGRPGEQIADLGVWTLR